MHLHPNTYKLLLMIRRSAWLIFKVVALDQVAKWWMISFLQTVPGRSYQLTSFLDLVYVWNYGISFGWFRQYYQYSNMAFIVINSFITCYVWYLALKARSPWSFMGYCFVIGGAVGNLIDRLFRKAVFDFIYFHYHDFGLFIFNVADVFISLGVVILLYDFYAEKKSVESAAKASYDQMDAEADRIRALDDNLSIKK